MDVTKLLIAMTFWVAFADPCCGQSEHDFDMLRFTWVSTGRSLGTEGDGPKVEEFVLVFTDENNGVWFHDNNGQVTRKGRVRIPLESQRKVLKAIRELRYPKVEFPEVYSSYFQVTVSGNSELDNLVATKVDGKAAVQEIYRQLQPLFLGAEAPLSPFRESCAGKIHPMTALGSLLDFRIQTIERVR